MLTNGLYAVDFQTPIGAGNGVVYLHNGKLRGGDSAIAYLGTYEQTGDKFSAVIQTRRHAAVMASVFGVDEVSMSISGNSTGTSASCTGESTAPVKVQIQVKLRYLSD